MNTWPSRSILCTLAAILLSLSSARAQFPRIVLVEEFTSVTCKPCTTASAVLNQLVRDKGSQVVTIRNQVNFPPAPNPYSTGETEGRKGYYSVETLPHGRYDGQSMVVTNQGEVYSRVEDRLTVESPIRLEVTHMLAGNTVNVQVRMTAGAAGLQGTYVLHVVAVEHEIHDPSILQIIGNNQEVTIHDVMRKMVNGPDGEAVSLNPDETRTVDVPYMLGNGWNPDQIYTIVFVQNTATNEVVQTAFSPRPGPVGSVDPSPLPPGFSIMSAIPTPSLSNAILPFNIGRSVDVSISIHAVDGTLLRRQELGSLEAGAYSAPIDLAGLAPGSYLCVVQAGDIRMTKRLVSHR